MGETTLRTSAQYVCVTYARTPSKYVCSNYESARTPLLCEICAKPYTLHFPALHDLFDAFDVSGIRLSETIHVKIEDFGGLSDQVLWIYPTHKHRIDKYRSMCATYRTLFLKELRQLFKSGKISYQTDIETLICDVENIRWVVHSTRPTMDTKVIEEYLAKYINRIAVSNKRLDYIKDSQKVILLHNDYKNQQEGQVAPKAYKIMEPIVAIDQILQHVLPAYFQKSRRYGIHNSSSKLKAKIPQAVKRNGQTVRTVFHIVTELLKLHPYRCEKCMSENHETEKIKPNKTWILTYINPNPRPPPYTKMLEKYRLI